MDNKKRLNEVSSTSLDVREDLVKRLLSVVPEAETDGKIDWDKLKQELTGVIDESPERYNFTWNGKKQAMKLAQLPSTATLKPNKEKSKNWDATENLYIEGDNLEVLKLLQKSYANKIKLIYIDPPYNTGKDFVYKDNFKDTLANYLEQTGQVDSDGNKLSVNTDTSGRYHTDWLNMMYPRLKLARNLLTDDGVIFISIDDSEVENLKKIVIEIFGEKMFVAQIPWRKRTAKSDVPFGVSQDYEWILVFAKSDKLRISVKGKERKYYESDDFPGEPWRIHDMTKQTTASERPNSYFTMINPFNGDEFPADPNATWRITKDTFEEYFSNNRIVFPGDYEFLGISKPVLRYWKRDDIEKAGDYFGRVAMSTRLPDEIGTTSEGTKDFAKLFSKKEFTFPKPVSLINYIVESSTYNEDNAIILDFFSGSGTTAEAVMKLNAIDGKNRKYILVQLPEEAIGSSYEKITDIAQERIRRAGDKIVDENPLFTSKLDIGFKVFELDKSNIKKWNIDSANLVDQIEMLQDNFETGSTPLDVVYEIMLKQGLSLTSHIVEENLDDSVVYTVEYGAMFIVLGDKINSSVANYIVDMIKELEPVDPVVVFQDQQFESDSEKLNAIEILNENGVEYDNILSI